MQNTTFPTVAEQADFGAPRAEIQDLPRGKIRLFGCWESGFVPRRSEAEPWNGAASPGEQKGYHPPSRRSDASFVTLEMQSFSVLEDRQDRSLRFLQWPCLQTCGNGWYSTPRCKKSSLYARIKQTVTTRQAAERYGLSVNRSGMTRCPFHEDHNPIMKVDDRFYCFGCGTSGDVIDFTARLFGISLKNAAQKLSADFGINVFSYVGSGPGAL